MVITPVSEKDRDRAEEKLAGKYYKSYDDTPPDKLDRFSLHGYYTITPNPKFKIDGQMISGTEVRKALRGDRSTRSKIDLFKQLYGKFDPTLFKKMIKKLKQVDQPKPHIAPTTDADPSKGSKGAKDAQSAQASGIDPNAKVRNPLTKRDILVKTALGYPQDHPAFKAARKMFKSGKLEEIFDSVMVEEELIKDFNARIRGATLGENRDELLIKTTDSAREVAAKVRKAWKKGIYHYALTHALHINRLPNTDGEAPEDDVPADGMHPKQEKETVSKKKEPLNDILDEADSPTTRTRRFNRRHKEKVKNYLRKTVNDRAARNRDRAKAVDTHGEEAMKDKDVHHPDGPHGGKTKVVKKDHGPDKKNEMISEGGAFGHMAHPYEDTELTFGDYKDIISKALTGDLADEEPVTEKTDGQNIAFTVKDGKIRFARNKGHTKDFGAGALDVQGMVDMFAGRGSLEQAFGGAAKDLQAAASQLDPDELRELFREGENFMSAEVIYPDTKNVVPYNKSILVLHGTITHDRDGNPTNFTRDTGKVMSDMINKVNAQRQKTFGIQSAKIITFNDSDTEKFAADRDKLVGQVDQLAAKFNLGDDSKVAEYYARWWSQELDSEAQKHGLNLTPDLKTALIKRFAFDDKSLKLNQIKDPAVKKWASDYQKGPYKDTKKRSQAPFEMIFLRTGATSLQRVESFMAANVPAGAEELKREIVDSLVAVQGMDDSDKAERMEYELDRLQKVGVDKIVPSEGLIFVHKGGLYKLPGTFAPINQLLGTLKFGRGAPPEVGGAGAGAAEEDPKKKGFIKQFYGDKITNPETGRQITIQSALTYEPEHPARKIALQYLSTRI